VFAVGRWDKVTEFAADVRESFRKFLGGRNDITLSAGIALIGSKYPIAKGAEQAGESEERAKKYSSVSYGSKNALDLFETTISWNDYREVEERKTTFLKLREADIIPAGLLQKIITFYQLKTDNERKKIKDLSYIWNAAYYLQRFATRHQKQLKEWNGAGQSLIDELKLLLVEQSGDEDTLKKLALAARWAELELRTTK
jgi:CRISPR-associated protein Csm1